jgi:GNAT superfamily N-acetyltransferase
VLCDVPAAISFRAATLADAEALAHGVVDGVEGYRAFAPPDWSPPSLASEIEHLRERLADEQVWCLLAEVDGEVVGQITVLPAARAGRPLDEPGLAHLSNIFVREDLWGSGLARELQAAGVEAARAHGFTAMRLFVAAGQARARRFYEREGWVRVGEEFYDPVPGLVLLEYRRSGL